MHAEVNGEMALYDEELLLKMPNGWLLPYVYVVTFYANIFPRF